MPLISSLRTRLFEEEDLESLIEHYVGSTGARFTRERFEWQYKINPASRGDPPGFVCEDASSGEFVGCIMSTPWSYRRGHEIYYCTIGSDAYVRPEYRKRGVYNLMAQKVLGDWATYLGSMRVLFYNQYTRNASTSADPVRATSVSLLFLNPAKAATTVWGESLKPIATHLLPKPSRKRNNTGVQLHPGTIQEYSAFYEEWADEHTQIHTPRSQEYLKWRFHEDPNRDTSYQSIWRGEELQGYITLLHEEYFASYQLDTIILSDYILKDDNPQTFRDAVTNIIDINHHTDLIVARAFTTPEYQRSLMELGFLDSMHFPLNTVVKPGGLGLRIYDERCQGYDTLPWYLCHSDCF